MGAKVSIETSHMTDTLTVPLQAVRASGEAAFVDVMTDGSVERRAVKLGERNAERVVVQEGLAEGDVVVLPGVGGGTGPS
jgi:multidrug efflux system membrane fusion protein